MTQIILEIGCNHKGEMDIAKQLLKVAKECGADVAKFQKRNNKELLPPEQYNAPHPVPENSFGETYGAHREFLEFDVSQHKELKSYAESIGLEYSTSVWDVTSAKEIAAINPKFIKVPSASNLHFDMLSVLADDYSGEVHLSLGMTTKEEQEKIVSFFEDKGRAKDLILYACTSGYPVPPEDVCLLEITRLKELYQNRVKKIGFSGHHISIYPDLAAVTLGAQVLERHFTLDRNWKGTDHAASLEPSAVKELVKAVREVEKCLTYKNDDLLDIEKPQMEKLKWRAA